VTWRRTELGLGDDYYQTSAGQRERLLHATDRLDKTSGRIQQGRQQLLETEVRHGAAAGPGQGAWVGCLGCFLWGERDLGGGRDRIVGM
jgi:hypothetical protein